MKGDLIIFGGSAGGLIAIREILKNLDGPLDATLVVVLHRHKSSTGSFLVESLARTSRMPVVETEDKAEVKPGHIFVAPADYHLLVERTSFSLSVDDPVNYSRPSLDVTLESAAKSFGMRVVAVIVSGANADGSKGALAVKRARGKVFVQDPVEAEAPEMPEAVISLVSDAVVMTTNEIAKRLSRAHGGVA